VKSSLSHFSAAPTAYGPSHLLPQCSDSVTLGEERDWRTLEITRMTRGLGNGNFSSFV
jgi:hypothetical protein